MEMRRDGRRTRCFLMIRSGIPDRRLVCTCAVVDDSGKQLFVWETKTAVRAVQFGQGSQIALFVTDATMGEKCTIHIVKIESDIKKQTTNVLKQIVITGSKATQACWGSLNKTIITGHEDGTITIWDVETGKVLKSTRDHTGQITDIQFGKTRDYFISSSKDHSAIIYNADTLEVFKKYQTERPIMLGGGQDAMNVTTTSAKQGKFEVRFYHLIFEEEIGRVKGHFGPINTLAFHPSGKGYASGGEDGFVRVHDFDESYFKFRFPEEPKA